MIDIKKIDRLIDELQEGPDTWANLMQLEKLYNLREKMEAKENGGKRRGMGEWGNEFMSRTHFNGANRSRTMGDYE